VNAATTYGQYHYDFSFENSDHDYLALVNKICFLTLNPQTS
jgi:hypothetical protein